MAPGAWDYAIARRGGEIAAVLPICRKVEIIGGVSLRMPKLTQTLGPWLRPSTAKYANQLTEQKDLMTELIEALPRHRYFSQNFHHSLTNWLPFYWKGFQQTTRYTYILDDLSDLDAVRNGFSSNIRGYIRKAQKQLRVESDLGLECFLQTNELTFERQGQRLPYTREFVKRIDEACKSHNARKMFFAVDDADNIHAVLYLVWTSQSAYLLMAGGDPSLRSSGASSLLVWHAIQFASGVCRTFDFEGSMLEPVERFFRAFGARQMPYSHVTKDRRLPFVRVLARARLAGKRWGRAVGVGR